MKCLVVYYSWSGRTKKVAEAIAAALSADLEPIREKKRRAGLFAYIRSAIEAKQRKLAPIQASAHDPADYDLVILGTPVWAGEISSPLRAYVEREKPKLKRVAFFCALGGSNGANALAGLRVACGSQPQAELLVDAHMLSGDWRPEVLKFASKLAAPAQPKVSIAEHDLSAL